jgi:hypothetical protein
MNIFNAYNVLLLNNYNTVSGEARLAPSLSFIVISIHYTSCNVHYSGSILHDNERETWSKSMVKHS